ncbi:MAG: hypothetical protein OJF51_000155 [Nitrospira sp.]|jgi:hypothetical protein|nr:MAG: hypothetical protein OJF51_000155 [Nitrospira sp.]
MMHEGKSMIVSVGMLIMAVSAALSPSSVLGEGGARRDVVRQAAEAAAAEHAAPSSLSKHATILNRDGHVVRIGSNGWICLPDDPNTAGTDSICMDESWRTFMDALKNKKKPTSTQVGIAYMLQGDRPVSNTDPYATEPKPGDDWIDKLGAHIMILLPDADTLKSVPTNPRNGGPWIMWAGTPYAHLMIPVDSYPTE